MSRKRYRLMRTRVANRQSACEHLESRRMLAGDFQAGDANQDYYFDEADVIQVMKFGKFNTGETANFSEGDWNDDGHFDVNDIVFAINTGPGYRQGPYDIDAGIAVNQLAPVATLGDPDLTIFYLPQNGTVVATTPTGMTALHIVSRSHSFIGNRGPGFFDASEPDSQFINYAIGTSWIEHPRLLPVGWSEQQVIEDLLVDGAMVGGGGLGNVRLGDPSEFPLERPDDALVIEARERPSFVEREVANGLVTYDPQTGDILIEALGVRMEGIELVSPPGFFTGTVGAEGRYTVGSFDEATPERFLRVAADASDGVIGFTPGFTTIYLPEIARKGLSADEFAAGVQPIGSTDPRGPLKLALVIGPAFAECQSHLADGVIPGDANLDGQFNTQDLVAVFQAGEYEDANSGNSTWREGDWTCDGDFDTGDLVAAFQAGNYELPAAAIALAGSDDGKYVPSFRQVDVGTRTTAWSDNQSDTNRKKLVGTAISFEFGPRALPARICRRSQ